MKLFTLNEVFLHDVSFCVHVGSWEIWIGTLLENEVAWSQLCHALFANAYPICHFSLFLMIIYKTNNQRQVLSGFYCWPLVCYSNVHRYVFCALFSSLLLYYLWLVSALPYIIDLLFFEVMNFLFFLGWIVLISFLFNSVTNIIFIIYKLKNNNLTFARFSLKKNFCEFFSSRKIYKLTY